MMRLMCVLAGLLAAVPSLTLAADIAFLDKEVAGQWRASKLPGVAIFGPDDRPVGKITDVLMGQDGKAQYLIVGVGGFLGLGQKDIAIPFDQVVFSDEPINAPPSTMGGSTRPAAPVDGAVAPPPQTAAVRSSGAPVPIGGVSAAGSPDPAPGGSGLLGGPSIGHPDHGRINMTADQVKAAPSFQFAP